MEKLLKLHFAGVVGGDTLDPMSSALGRTLESDVLRWHPQARVSSVPWASMTKLHAITIASRLVAENASSFLFSMRATAQPVKWSLESERRIVLGLADTVDEGVVALDKSLPSPVAFVGAACRARFLRKRECVTQGLHMPDMWVRTAQFEWIHIPSMARAPEGPAWNRCTTFASIPKTEWMVGLRNRHVLLGTRQAPLLHLETTVRSPDMVECEVIPSGSIVITVGKRNEDTGGSYMSETMAFRVRDDNTLDPVCLTKEEAAEAQANAEARESSKVFDFACITSPMSAQILSPWHSRIVFQEDVVYEDEGHGTVVGISGHAEDMWIAHATGIVVHIVHGEQVERLDVGCPCTASITLPRA
jgi:hypothetical protein